MLAKLFLLAFVVAAVLSPPEPLYFTAILIPAWVVAFPLAYFLIYRGGYASVRASRLYQPGPLAGGTTSWFAGTALALKIALSLFVGLAVGGLPYAIDLLLSIGILGVSYALVYQGVYGMFLET